RAGAHDFMTKGQFARLIPAIQRELREASIRADSRRLQEQLLVSDRMASVGTLAAGVAHEINNPLAVVIANVECAVREMAMLVDSLRATAAGESGSAAEASLASRIASEAQEIQEPIRDAREAAERVRQIVRDLKIFSRTDEQKRGAVDVKHVLESALRMTWNEIRHRAEVVREYSDVPFVEGNEARLGQVFLNLLMNSAQAIPDGRADHNRIRIATRLESPGRVLIEVEDTGSGIPEDVIARMYDPFFTTKPVGVGTGLGLAVSHRIITALGGEISCESTVGKGTRFRIVLPVAKSQTLEAAPARPATPTARRGRILVVDDERSLGLAIRRMLAGDHKVDVTTSAREAIERVQRGEHFDVILCDLMMPEVTGMDVCDELTRTVPDQAAKIIFMTGGAFTQTAQEFFERVPNLRVEKPFDLAALRAVIAQVIQ
ncbi:MAG TPA: ATP-binding protein, partial [bacterium]|nr:ATP-binding protein [bacterium]